MRVDVIEKMLLVIRHELIAFVVYASDICLCCSSFCCVAGSVVMAMYDFISGCPYCLEIVPDAYGDRDGP